MDKEDVMCVCVCVCVCVYSHCCVSLSELSYVIPLQGMYPKKTKALIRKDTGIPMFIEALFTIAKMWKQSKCSSIDEWIKKM